MENNRFKLRKLGECLTDTASLAIIDPCAINKEKTKEWVKEPFVSSSLGHDGAYEVFGKFDENAKYPHIPFEIIIKIRV